MKRTQSSVKVNRILSDENIESWLNQGLKPSQIVSLTNIHSNYVYKAVRKFKESK